MLNRDDTHRGTQQRLSSNAPKIVRVKILSQLNIPGEEGVYWLRVYRRIARGPLMPWPQHPMDQQWHQALGHPSDPSEMAVAGETKCRLEKGEMKHVQTQREKPLKNNFNL